MQRDHIFEVERISYVLPHQPASQLVKYEFSRAFINPSSNSAYFAPALVHSLSIHAHGVFKSIYVQRGFSRINFYDEASSLRERRTCVRLTISYTLARYYSLSCIILALSAGSRAP